MRLSLLAANARFVHSSPSLFYLRAALERHLPACQITLRQLTINDPYYDALLAVLADEPEAVLVSAYVWSDAMLRRLLVDLRQARPELPLVAGGPQAPHLQLPPEVAVSVVEGPVEGVGPDFYRDLAAGHLQPHYQAESGATFAMPYRAADFSAGLAHRQLYYESSRGCPFACSYCLSAARPGVELLPLDQVKGELTELLAHEPPIIRFVDRTFNSPPERALALWRWLAAQPGATRCHFEIAPELFTAEQLDFLATVPAGRFQFEIGLQSFHPEALAAVNRRPDLPRAVANIRRLRAAGNIHLHLDLILGLPFETAASYHEGLNKILALRPHQLQLGLLKVLPDTPLAARREEFALRHCRQPPYQVLANRWLKQPELAALYRLGEVIEAFYNPRFFRTTLAWLLARQADPAAFFARLAELCRQRDFFSRARTQQWLSELLLAALVEDAATWPAAEDPGLGRELLLFDWLACGYRRLPAHLLPPERVPAGSEPAAVEQLAAAWLKEAKDRLWRQLPADLPPHYDPQSRSAFFKRTVFAPFSAASLRAAGLEAGGGEAVVAFVESPADTFDLRRTAVVLPIVQ
ncbi:MAG: DUF4080 domain-containing protein [Desulfurivibrio sp.]|nr:DUF4080 domain-containing protein [Desulfurivibrio sp.]